MLNYSTVYLEVDKDAEEDTYNINHLIKTYAEDDCPFISMTSRVENGETVGYFLVFDVHADGNYQ
ncbi:hypothetical protein SAMN04487944_101204 [Gracilibacillus ureilyticus]|uniref:Uncharacterized protein n=1 Tax=Gracilibacillus ureilyticus TaxID=531814 RepID=A0A1H9LCV4_9BACI|nr:hypothetical protein [Gracilibacillus ureilyticus]SER09322.1 hypothetical protein SAMN04487944_101204 [Gracilibacillus ureilyticus]